MKKILGVLMISSLILLNQQPVNAQESGKNRADIADKFKWDLTDIFKSDAEWKETKEEIVKSFDNVNNYKGKLANSSETLAECLSLSDDIIAVLIKLSNYASQKYDSDLRQSKYQAMSQEMDQIYTEYSSKVSFIEPEILEMGKEKIEEFINSDKKLENYDFYLRDIVRQAEHTLSDKEENIIAQAGLMASAPSSIYGIFSNTDLPYPDIELTDGTKIHLNPAAYGKYRALPNREDRKIVFNAFFDKLNSFKRTFATQLNYNIKKDLFYTKVRKYDTCLESALAANNIPTEVYYQLIKNVDDNLDTYHRYLQLKTKLLGVDTLQYFDLYAPVVKDVDADFSYEEAQDMVVKSLNPLGKKYTKVIKKAFKDRWIDFYPSTGKRSGAYSSGSIYDLHPYILLNYNGLYNDVSTLTHELGHTMHSYYSNHNQPRAKARYSIFVAEVASTFNEILLFKDYLKSITDEDQKLSLLMSYLDGIKGTVFRQTMFAEFELRIHEMAERGEQLTGDSLNELYKKIVRKYNGHDKGVCVVPDYIDVEWAYIPHFYYNFYVYQYATSYTASVALSNKVLNGDKNDLKNYLNFISSGGSDYPVNILKNAGVDMTTSEPFDLTMKEMNWAMDEIEKIIK